MPHSSKPPPAPLTYRAAGVDIDAGNEAVRRIRRLVARTRRPEQLSDIGSFAGLMAIPAGLREPILVSSTDSVGTKVLVAIALGRHDTIGIDVVAMNVNDILVTGAAPLFLLDYLAVGHVDPAVIEAIVAGVVEGCCQASCSLLGGETAELPGLYADGHYDLAAFVVGVVERGAIWAPDSIREGDVVLALPSSGVHSNGLSLARKALVDPAHGGLAWNDPLPGGVGETVGDALLSPTRIYERAFAALRALPGGPVHGAAHITGGGLIDNPPRALPESMAVALDLGDVPRLPVFAAIAACGPVVPDEMLRTFNCGVGMLLYVDRERVDEVQASLSAVDETSYRVGTVRPRNSADEPRVHIGV